MLGGLDQKALAVLLGWLRNAAGAVATTIKTWLSWQELNAFEFMTPAQIADVQAGTLLYDVTAPLKAAIAAASGKTLKLPAGVYKFDPSGGTTTLGCILKGDGRNVTKVKIFGNGDLFQRSSYSVLQDLTIDMNGATYSGHACKFATASAQQTDRSVEILNCAAAKYAHNFSADGGSQFYSDGSTYHTLAAGGTDAAVKVTGADSTAVPRVYVGTEGNGCTIWDFGSCNDFFVYGGFTAGLLFGAAGSRVMIDGLRIGTMGGTVTIKGASHKIKGCVFADPVILDAGSSEIHFDSECPSYNVTDNGTNNSVYQGKVSYVPTVTGSVSNLTLGNGSLSGRYSREGKKIRFYYDYTKGSTDTLWAGNVFFSLPRADINSGPVEIAGTAWIQTGAGAATLCMVRVEPGLQKVSLFYINAGNGANVTAAAPYAIGNGDNIRIQGEYFTT